MKGWKTWAAAAALAVLGLIDIINDDIQAGVEKLTGALALVGLGHKLEKGFGGQMVQGVELVADVDNPQSEFRNPQSGV